MNPLVSGARRNPRRAPAAHGVILALLIPVLASCATGSPGSAGGSLGAASAPTVAVPTGRPAATAPGGAPGSEPPGSFGPPTTATPPGLMPASVERPVPGLPDAIAVYAGVVSVLPGERIPLKVSTSASSYGVTLDRVTATGQHRTWAAGGLPGIDQRDSVRFDAATTTVRAHWATTLEVPTSGDAPGVYIVTAKDSRGSVGRAIVVVRSATIRPDAPAFVYDAITQAAYNGWGGASFYRPVIGTVVSFDRPLEEEGGLGVWPRSDARLVPWLMARLPNLQFTTDYDLAVAPPVAAPSALLFGYHTEYVAPSMRDWVRGHLATGRMSLAIFGANSFYWRVRLQAAPGPGLPDELACYKIHPSADPLSATAPTGLYRNLGEPEGAWLGSQYVGVVFDGRRRVSAALTDAVPPALLEGTGWGPGTVLRGFVSGEADAAYLPGPGGAAPGGTATLSRSAGVVDEHGIPIQPATTATVTRSGARVFDAGTFAFADFLAPAKVDLGVRHGSFDRFARNVLTWLGLRVH